MKCFERIVFILKHIKDIIPVGLDQYQFAYRENRSTEDAVSIALHTALTHLQLPNTYVRMLFVDFSSAFNTVIPDNLQTTTTIVGLISDNDETHYREEILASYSMLHLVKKAQQRLFFLRKLKRAGLSSQLSLPQCSSVVWQLHCTRPKKT
ncbi:hypothetical protein L3Q82_015779 [Scortum barcoo]|uniref:Uncharacterized protein n=1 Tax=Scortum barcoo TaxID=214431 RepID=A0ACB8VP93_9TELE|nr:hypothetical protein L3Q82_015779 [Scortum barcoo]